MADEPTFDPGVVIEARKKDAQGRSVITYRNNEGRRWDVIGDCDRRGDCLVGAVDGGKTLTKEDVEASKADGTRYISKLDVPVTPEFNICCGADLFTYRELPAGPIKKV